MEFFKNLLKKLLNGKKKKKVKRVNEDTYVESHGKGFYTIVTGEKGLTPEQIMGIINELKGEEK